MSQSTPSTKKRFGEEDVDLLKRVAETEELGDLAERIIERIDEDELEDGVSF